MLQNTEPLGYGSTEVAVVLNDRRCGEVVDIKKAELAPRGGLLAYLGVGGRLVVQDVDSGAPPFAAAGHYNDFYWEEPPIPCDSVDCSSPPTHFRLLAVGYRWDLKLLEVKAEPDFSVSLQCMCELSAEHLLHTLWEEDPDVCELQSVHLLGFTAGRCLLLLNGDRLLHLQWQQKEDEKEEGEDKNEEESKEEHLQMVSSSKIQMADTDTAVHHCVCRKTLFILRSNGLISVHDINYGHLLASVDLPSYFSPGPADDELTSSLSSSCPLFSTFCLLQVSADLSTVVAITQSHMAVAVDLNHYFRVFPAHLLCSVSQSHSAMRTSQPSGQGSLPSSGGVAGLSAGFSTDGLWEARLTSMYNRAQNIPFPHQASSPHWWYLLPHLVSMAPSSAHSRVPPGGATTTFSVSESAVPSQLTVSAFTALLSFMTPGNRQTTVTLWDMESQEVRYHRAEGEATSVQRCGERQHRFLLRQMGVFQVLFGVSQQDLLSRLMLFGSAATVDAVCHLNSWGRCSIPIHTLQAGLKNRQLDTVDFYLKSKENILNLPTADPCAAFMTKDHTWPMDRVLELCPALDLLCSAIRDSNSELQSRQFSEQLLNITLSFINIQIRTMMSCSNYEDSGVQNAVEILDRYVMQLRSYLKRFPRPAVGEASSSTTHQEVQRDEWDLLPMEEVVHQSILSSQIPRAQVVLQRRSLPEHLLTALRTEGLRQVFCCLQIRDLQTANTLLTNMGFSVKKQLHSICLYTDNKKLRETMVEKLSHLNHFSKEEMQSVEFIREMEMLGSLPAFRYLAPASSQRVLCLHSVKGLGEEILKQIIERGRFKNQEEEVGLWRNLRLDWVKNWDDSSRTAVSLSRFQHTELTSCDSSVLWYYLTSIHNKDQILDWIQNTGTSGFSQWPELSPELVEKSTACSTYMTDGILDILARRDLFIPKEMADLEQLLWRLAQCGGLMALSTSIFQYRSDLGLDFHSVFITFCLQHSLHYLLFTYLEHYKLTPRNCPLLSQQNVSETQPWFEMLVKIQEITRDLSDPQLVFQASLTSAQVLLPGSQASLNSLLLEGHSQLALAAIMFAPGGLNQVMTQSKRLGQSEGAVDPQLLKMALATHPKLKATLFPSAPRGTGPPSDVSVYHLLQSLSPLDPSILFSWQAANTLNYTETSELPHFSSPHLVSKFALMETLDFLFYLRHGRPSFAYATFLVQQLCSCSDIKLLLHWAHQQVYKLTLQFFSLPSVTSAAVCFFELLGLCSLKLRVDIRAMNAILHHWNQQRTHTAPAGPLQTLVSKSVKLVEAELETADELIQYLEVAVMDTVEQKGLTRSSYEASQEWVLPIQFCQLHGRCLTSVYPLHCAEDGQFIQFLLFVQLHNFPSQQVRSLVAQFDPTLQAHLSLAFQDLQVYSQTSGQDTEIHPKAAQNKSLSAATKPEHPRELFEVLLESQEESRPWKYLLQEALIQCCPTMAVLAVCLQGAEVLQCLCVWVLTSIHNNTAVKAITHLAVAPEHHEWTLHDLSIIWKTLLSLGHVRPLLQGFELFQRDCPLVLVLRMFELCCNHKNFTEAKLMLMDFQKTLIALRNSGAASESLLPLQWVESQASVLVLTMLQHCSSHYDLHRLLQLLAGVDKLIKSNGPDFRKLSQLSQLLQGSKVSLSPQLLQCSSALVQQEEFQCIIGMLHSRGLYSQARQVALLADLPIQCLLLSQLHQEVSSQKSRRHWGRLETRMTFWKKCHEQLKADCSDPTSASHFFLSQAESNTVGPPVVSGPHTELLDLQEHSLLLSIAAHWLSLLRPAPIDQLESLEKELWMNQVRKLSLQAAVEKESVFNLPHDTGMYEVLMKEFSFSNISDLNRDKCLSLDEVPGPNANMDSEWSPQESSLLAALIGQLLDNGSIHEASRVCRYFSLYNSDLWVVLRCRGLASGHLNAEPEEKVADGPTKSGLSTSHSYSSLSSFLMLPEDEVAVHFQKLLDHCYHGKNYCRQVLGLYQLSKELQCSFSQICNKEPHLVLEMLLQSEQLERFKKAQVFIKAQSLSVDTIAQLVSSWVVQGLISLSQELQPVFSAEKLIFRPSEGRDSLMQLIKLCEDPNLVGLKLLENLNTVPLRDLPCIVELLIVAHDCFSLTCNMEGIVRVLQAARHLSHTYLSPGEHHSLLVRLLTGIGRYNEMTYIFDLLNQNHCFEMLLRKKVDSERGQNSSLKTALLDYIKRCLPADSEKHNMVALCFSMRREIGENHEMAARTQLKIIESQAWVVTSEFKSSLMKVLSLLKDAAESFSKDSCVRQASRCVRTAKLVTLQLHFLNQGSELRIINLRPSELLGTMLALPRCYQVFVVSEAYSYSPDWAEILYQKVVLHGDFFYLEEFKFHRGLNSGLFEDIFKRFDGPPSSIAPNVKRLLSYCDDVYTRYRLAYQQNLYDVTKTLLQDSKTSNYLNDRLAS